MKANERTVSLSKHLYWKCRCGCVNPAPADQSARNTVVCSECDAAWEWKDVAPAPSKEAP
jgi:hypothetical protein